MLADPDIADLPEPESHRERISRHMAALKELGEIGMDLARVLGRKALAAAEAGEDDGADAGLMFSRVSRAVRQTISLEARLSDGLRALDEAGVKGQVFDFAGASARVEERLARLAEAPEVRAALRGEYDESEDEDFGDGDSLEAVIVAVRRNLGLPDLGGGEFAESALTQSAHPGEGRDPDDKAPGVANCPADIERTAEPYDLGPGLRRGERGLAVAGPLQHAAHGPPPPTGEELMAGPAAGNRPQGGGGGQHRPWTGPP